MIAVMIIPCVASCGGGKTEETTGGDVTTVTPEEENKVPDNYTSIDITKYVIMRADKSSEIVLDACSELRTAIEDNTGYDIKLKNDFTREETPIKNDNFEILVGNTNRAETAEVLATIDGSQWAIRFAGNKIVIVGTSDSLTAIAIEYFVSNYILKYSDTNVINLPADLNKISEQYEPIKISVVDGRCDYKVVYEKGLDISAGSSETDKYDWVGKYVQDIVAKLKKGLDSKVSITSDSIAEGFDISGVKEILIGKIARDETKEFLSTLKINEYGYAVIGNKIVIAGWSDITTGLAAELFMQALDRSFASDEDGKRVDLIYSDPVIRTYSGFNIDVPKYEGGTLKWCADLTEGGLEFLYTNTTAVAFGKYCDKLKANGYTLEFENESAGNKYATFSSAKTMIHVYYTLHDESVRLIAAPMSKTNLPNFKTETYEKVAAPAITQLALAPKGGGNCYILTLEDGSYVIYDGGTDCNENIDRLYNFMAENNKRKDGKIVIAAWFLTHEHGDHYGLFVPFCQKYGKQITIEQFICNTPSEVFRCNPRDGGAPYENSFGAGAYEVEGGIKVVKAHTGQIIKIRNVEIEVIFTIEDIFPQYLHVFNDASMVTRIKMAGQTFMMLGDAEQQACNIMLSMYGDYLKSDIVQIAHHGYGRQPFTIYQKIAAKVALWPSDKPTFEILTKPTGTGYYGIGYPLITQGNFVDMFLADQTTVTLMMPYTPGSGTAIKKTYTK